MSAGTSAGKSLALSGKLELEKLLRNMDFYYRKESKNRKKTLICPSGTNVLKDNMVDTFIRFNPSFTYKVVSNNLLGVYKLEELVTGTSSIISSLTQSTGTFSTTNAGNRYGYIKSLKFNKVSFEVLNQSLSLSIRQKQSTELKLLFFLNRLFFKSISHLTVVRASFF
jgi:hypothetical protein